MHHLLPSNIWLVLEWRWQRGRKIEIVLEKQTDEETRFRKCETMRGLDFVGSFFLLRLELACDGTGLSMCDNFLCYCPDIDSRGPSDLSIDTIRQFLRRRREENVKRKNFWKKRMENMKRDGDKDSKSQEFGASSRLIIFQFVSPFRVRRTLGDIDSL